MNNLINLDNSTIVTGATSTGTFLVTEINNKQIGIPLYKFASSVPDLDIVEMFNADLDLHDVTLFGRASSYGAGLAVTVNTSAASIPLYKLDQSNSYEQSVVFQDATIVTSLTSTSTFVVVKVDDVGYGIPLYDYSMVFPSTSSVPMSSIPIETKIVLPTNDMSSSKPSTNLNSKIKTYKGLIDRVKYQLGAPFINLEVCEDTQMVDFIDKALEWYTKYAGFTEEYLVFDSRLYSEPGIRIDELFTITPTMYSTFTGGMTAGYDYDLGDYRRVNGVFGFEQGETTGINTLFTLEQAMAQQTYFSYMLGNAGFDLVTWEVLKGWLDLREKVLAQVPYIDFDQRNQTLRIIPAPNNNSAYYGCVGAWVEKPIRDLIMERWVEHYTLAITKIAIGNIRGKYQNMQLFGGGVINYNDLLSQGLTEKKELEEELMLTHGEVTPARFFIG